jgi:hypothetical protein
MENVKEDLDRDHCTIERIALVGNGLVIGFFLGLVFRFLL